MKKKLILLICALLALSLGALAEHLPLVVDDAGLLASDEIAALETRAREISEAHGMDVVIWTTDETDDQAIRYRAADFYDYSGYGQGTDHDGVMLMLSMAERNWFILTTGSGIRAFTDYGIQWIGADIRPALSDGNYAAAFDRFLSDAEDFILQAQAGDPYDVDNEPDSLSPLQKLLITLGVIAAVSLVITLIVMHVLKRQLHSARPQTTANRYVRDGSLRMRAPLDLFLYQTQTRRKIEKSDSDSGGSSTFTSSSDTEHGGGGGSF